MTGSPAHEDASAGYCSACAAKTGCDCVILPDEFRSIGFSGLFHAVTDLAPGAYEAFRDRVPCLISADRWVLASVDEATMTGVLVRKDSAAIVEALTRPAPHVRDRYPAHP